MPTHFKHDSLNEADTYMKIMLNMFLSMIEITQAEKNSAESYQNYLKK